MLPKLGRGGFYRLIEDPYFDGPANTKGFFIAKATDIEGNYYEVYWDILDGMEESEDMQDMCEWDKPSNVVKL